MSDQIGFIEVKPEFEHRCTIIWLHGLGDSGHGHAPLASELKLAPELGVKFIFPHAPEQPVTVNGGAVMPAWYDILEMDIGRKIDEDGIEESAKKISDLIKAEIENGIESKNILIAGFSQGGAVALHTALQSSHSLAGIICMSTYLGADSIFQSQHRPINQNIPIFWGHGTYDAVVPLALAETSIETLNENNYKVELKTYPMEHSLHPDEVSDISEWISVLLEA